MRDLYETYTRLARQNGVGRAIHPRMSPDETHTLSASTGALPPLPAAYAFVVQLGRDSDPALGRFDGQIEHLASGRQGRFSNQQEMLAFLEHTLAQSIAPPSGR